MVAKLQRRRRYDDEIQRFDLPHLADALKWSYYDQSDIIFDTNIESPKSVEDYVIEEEVEEEVERGKHLRQANTIVLISILRQTIKDDNDKDDDDNNDDNDDDDNDEDKDNEDDDDDDDDDGDFERILRIVFYDFLGILGGFQEQFFTIFQGF